MALTLLLKYGLVAIFSTVAMALLCCGPVLYPGYSHMSQMELFEHILPNAIIAIILVSVDFMFLVNSTLWNVKAFNKFAKKLAEGDYSQKPLKVLTRDDFGLLVNSLNHFFSNTKNLLTSLNDSVSLSSQAANDSSASMEEITGCVQQIVESIDQIRGQMGEQSSGVEEAAAIIREITDNIDGLNDTVSKQVAAVEESSAAVHQMVANIQSVTTILDKNSASTQQLALASEEGRQGVRKAVELADAILEDSKGLIEASNVVQNIASQTNLLAMNAAIEAAHAGELGKGFAVVADEIRKLAEQSNVQGKRITESLSNLESRIQGVSGSTRDLNGQFEKIFELTQVVQQQEVVVTNAMTEQAAGSNQIIAAMQHIDDATQEVRSGTRSILEGSKQISEEMDMLAKSTVRTNENVAHMSQNAVEINEAVEKGNAAASQNSESISRITEEISKFKL